MAVIKPKSQIDKRVDAMGGGGGGTYYAGQGLSLKNSTFSLNVANQADIGGIRIAGVENVSADDPSAEYGIFKKTYDGFPALRTALSYQKGGFFLGDGFVPELEEEEKYGETYFSPNGYVRLRIGEGLEFVDNDEAATDPKELKENSTGGRKVAVKVDGQTVKLNDNGQLSAEGYAEGAAIAFSTANEQKSINVKYDDVTIKLNGGDLAVNIDNDTIQVNDDGKLASIGVTIENGIIIQEADAQYLLHEYEIVEYIQGNKLVYGAQPNPIIIGSYPADSALYRSEIGYDPTGSAVYQDVTFKGLAGTATTAYEDYRLYLSVTSIGATSSQIRVYDSNGVAKGNARTTYDLSRSGFNFEWTAIHASTDIYPYGYATVTVRVLNVDSTGALVSDVSFGVIVGFVSEAEYNYACGITYKPNTLTQVNETVTEV